ncbi:hypothetical protein RvY_09403 [Ramazzottius varieornatus]|uniref:Tetratricopeptide repeat protein 7 N-terminal domain-containing protein n=1 Tax=Ramazzottius varieornatus TaxID=947166 RepID=A0A1D1VEQ8_RAMVA|nr:hypothetical protein RvY_09403 [Ramazzottius varieornatus]
MDIEKLRQDCLWDRIIAYYEGQKLSQNNALDEFYLVEARLEKTLERAAQRTTVILPDETSKALVQLKNVLSSLSTTSLPGEITRLIRFLLAKIYFVLGDLSECLITLEKSDLNRLDLSQEVNRRNLQIFAEAFCLKGVCLNRPSAGGGRSKRNDRPNDKSMPELEIGTDVGLRCAQMVDPTSREAYESQFTLGDFLESIIIKVPTFYAKNGALLATLSRLRDTLRVMESPATRKVRLLNTRQLVDVFLRGHLGLQNYLDPRLTEKQTSAGASASLTVPRPKKYQTNGAFVPVSLLEEVMLLISVCEAVITRESSSRPSDAEDRWRQMLIKYSITIVDLCMIAVNRLYQLDLGSPFLMRSAKMCPNSLHVWKQSALISIVKGNFSKGLHILEQCFRLMPKDRTLIVFSACICLERLTDLDKGIRYAEDLCRITERSRLSGRSRLMLGIACSLSALRARETRQQAVMRAKALKHYTQSESEDPQDFLAQYYLALELCMERNLDEAFRHVKKSLRLNMDFLPAHHLLALILSSWKRYADALTVLEKTEVEFEEEVEIELTKIRLLAKIHGAEHALKSCRHVLATWKNAYERVSTDSDREGLRTVTPEFLNVPVSPLSYNQPTSPLPQAGQSKEPVMVVSTTKGSPSSSAMVVEKSDAASFRAESVATIPRTEVTMSEMASTTGSYLTKSSSQHTFHTQMHIWVLMAELYLEMGHNEAAMECLSEASGVGQPSHLVFHLQGTVTLRKKGNPEDAKRYFDDALGINPWFPPSHVEMGRLKRQEKCFPEAERHFREALLGDPSCHEAWAALGELFVENGNDEKAMVYLEKARQMEMSKPIQPFYNIPRSLTY